MYISLECFIQYFYYVSVVSLHFRMCIYYARKFSSSKLHWMKAQVKIFYNFISNNNNNKKIAEAVYCFRVIHVTCLCRIRIGKEKFSIQTSDFSQ